MRVRARVVGYVSRRDIIKDVAITAESTAVALVKDSYPNEPAYEGKHCFM